MNIVLAALAAAIAPLENYAVQKLESIGASLAAGVAAIFLGFTNDQRAIFANVTAYWQAIHNKEIAAGSTPLSAIENASTATLNEFCAEEGAELDKEKRAFITLLASSITNNVPTGSGSTG